MCFSLINNNSYGCVNLKYGYSTAVLLFCSLAFIPSIRAEEFFNPAFISGDTEAVADLSRFEKGEGQAAGMYRVDVYLNDELLETNTVRFIPHTLDFASRVSSARDDSGLQACLERPLLTSLNLSSSVLAELERSDSGKCIDLGAMIPHASSVFDFEKQRLNISIPQAFLKSSARGFISPAQWNQGIPALLMNYDFTGNNSHDITDNKHRESYFLNLNTGINFGAWRLRNVSTWNYDRSGAQHQNSWENISTYLQRSIVRLKSKLLLGDSSTGGDIFDSVLLRGVALSPDDNMLPDSLRGFAPTIRGVAKSNAKVTIRQNDYVIYQSYVSPGAFEISDLYATSSSGDLRVTLEESDGSSQSFVVPYSAVPLLQREGRLKFSLYTGRYRSGNTLQDRPYFTQSTIKWGLPYGLTAYGGTQLSSRYRAFAFGLGKNLGDWGALSTDLSYSESRLADGSHHQGQSLRLLYAKTLNDFGTNFQLMGYRYSTQGYYSLADTTYRRMSGRLSNFAEDNIRQKTQTYDIYDLRYTKKGRVQINLNQQLGDLGSLFISGSRQNYWQSSQTDHLLQLGFSGMFNFINYGLVFSYTHSAGLSADDKRVALNFSFPLGRWLTAPGRVSDLQPANNMYGTWTANSDSHGHLTQQAGISGTLLSDSNLNYSVQQGYANHNVGSNGSVALSYQGGYSNSNVGYNYSKGYQQINYGLSGGIVMHSDGITLSQPLSDTNVLIKAPGASGVSIENTTGVHTDWRGYAVLPYATTYQRNRIALDINTLPDEADVEEAVKTVIPTQGALVRADFATHLGSRALLTLRQKNGKPVPFGAIVQTADRRGSSIVGDDGQVYLSGLAPSGSIKVQWGGDTQHQCKAFYQLAPVKTGNQAMLKAEAACQ